MIAVWLFLIFASAAELPPSAIEAPRPSVRALRDHEREPWRKP